MEDLIININESMKTRAQYIILEQKLNAILSEKKSPEDVKKTALEINPDFKKNIVCAMMISKEPASNLQVHTYFDNLMYHRSKIQDDNSCSFVKSGRNIILILSFDDEKFKTISLLPYIKDILINNGFTPSSFFIGWSKEAEPLSALDNSVKKAQIAGSVCSYRGAESLEYCDVGIHKYALSIVNDDILCNEVIKKMKILKEYDLAHDSNLIKTLVSFVNNNGDYSATSEECFQHTNTIRYRIKKAAQMMELAESTADEEITLITRCYLIIKAISPNKI